MSVINPKIRLRLIKVAFAALAFLGFVGGPCVTSCTSAAEYGVVPNQSDSTAVKDSLNKDSLE